MINSKNTIINTPELVDKLETYFNKLQPEYCFLDVETDGVVEKKANLYGVGLCFNDKYAFYIPWRNKEGSLFWDNFRSSRITKLLETITKNTKVINHNIIFDLLIVENQLGFSFIDNIYSDTILLYHTLNEDGCDGDKPFGLKEICEQELGPWAIKAKEALLENIVANGGKTTKKEMEMFKADTEVLGVYCCWDVILTCKLFYLLEQRLIEENLAKFFYEDEVMPLYKTVTIPMKRNGFPIDVPHYERLKLELISEINKLEDEVTVEIEQKVSSFCIELIEKVAPINNAGSYPKVLAELIGAPLPITKDGKVTLAKKAVELQAKASPEYEAFYKWLIGDLTLSGAVAQGLTLQSFQTAQIAYYKLKTGKRYIFNLNSPIHLRHLFIDVLGYKPEETTEKGQPKLDKEFFDSIKSEDPTIQKFIDYKKLGKLLSTYVIGILDRQVNGKIYTSMLQFGTTSGRYASRDPNCQNLPKIQDEESGLSPIVLHYVNAIRKGFKAPKGYKVVNADYSQLEPRVFSHISSEQTLIEAFKKDEDFYSKLAIGIYGLKDSSANKKDSNFLKKIHPHLRDKGKIGGLAIVYGAEESRLKDILGCDYKEAKIFMEGFFKAYPNIHKYMHLCNYEAKTKGFVTTEFGRVRHLPEAKKLYETYGNDLLDYQWAKKRNLLTQRRQFKNLLNNAKNVRIQGTAAHLVNRAMISVSNLFKNNNINGYIALSIHDEITCIVKEEQAELAANLLQEAMENTTKISVPLSAVPLIADNWGDAK